MVRSATLHICMGSHIISCIEARSEFFWVLIPGGIARFGNTEAWHVANEQYREPSLFRSSKPIIEKWLKC
jgi:hypothetical protein